MARGGAIMQGSSIYSFGGWGAGTNYPIQRLDMTEEGTIEHIELIGNQTTSAWHPILIITDSNTCVTN